MKFTLITSSWDYPECDHLNELKKLGFKFVRGTNTPWVKTSGAGVPIEFNTLEELADFSRKWGTLKLYNKVIEIWDK